MTITLYNSVAERDKLDKSSDLTLVATLTGYLRNGTSIVDPVIDIEQATLPAFNYIQITDFGRYYFVTKVVSVASGLWRIYAHVDVLYTYKDTIITFKAKIARNEHTYDLKLTDPDRVTENKYDVQIVDVGMYHEFSLPSVLPFDPSNPQPPAPSDTPDVRYVINILP